MLIVDARKSASIGAVRFIGLLLIVSNALPIPVRAQSARHPVTVLGHREDINTRIVPYGDLSLTTREGRKTLMRRVEVAVDQVCPEYDAATGQWYTEIAECKHFAWMGAQTQINNAFALAVAGGTSLSAAIEISAPASH